MSVAIATRQGVGADELSSVYLSSLTSGGGEPVALLIEV